MALSARAGPAPPILTQELPDVYSRGVPRTAELSTAELSTADIALAAESDGRRLRREQNREAVIDALLALFREGVCQPGTAQIATRAGLSPRSLFRYFDDVDDLHQAAADRQIRQARPLLARPADPGAPLGGRIDAVVRARVRLFEEIGPAARALRAGAARHPRLAERLAHNRAFLRAQLAEVFAADETLLAVLDVLCSFESYELLRQDQGLSRDDVVATLTAAMTALLTQPGGTDV
jgi:TetR/AcrR family transcriptional regulator, regulator of autoinduction and epiphytic fitness